jgi:hypothetical protein
MSGYQYARVSFTLALHSLALFDLVVIFFFHHFSVVSSARVPLLWSKEEQASS